MKTTRLPSKLTIALGQYFLNYQLQKPQIVSTTYRSGQPKETTIRDGREWNKEEDLQRITDALPKDWGYQASGGSFWIIPPLSRSKTTHYYTHSGVWPLAEIRKNKRP